MNETTPTEHDQLVSEVAARWLDGLAGAERDRAEGLVRELVADWEREAAASKQPAAVLQILRDDDRALVAATLPPRRGAVLEQTVVRRLVDSLAGRTWKLGTAIIDGAIVDPDARDEGKALLAEADALGPRVKALAPSNDDASITRTLSDAVMEALFAVERQAMSARLDRYRRDRAP